MRILWLKTHAKELWMSVPLQLKKCLLYQLSNHVQAVMSSAAGKALMRQSQLLKSVNGTLEQQADTVTMPLRPLQLLEMRLQPLVLNPMTQFLLPQMSLRWWQWIIWLMPQGVMMMMIKIIELKFQIYRPLSPDPNHLLQHRTNSMCFHQHQARAWRYDVPVRIRWLVQGHEVLLVVELPAAQALGPLQGHLGLTCLCPGLIGTLYWFYTTERAFVKF